MQGVDPLAEAAAVGAERIQISLSDPQSWEKPPPRADAAELRASPVGIYVHAPFLINVCSPKPNVRYGSRKILQQTCDAAAAIGALDLGGNPSSVHAAGRAARRALDSKAGKALKPGAALELAFPAGMAADALMLVALPGDATVAQARKAGAAIGAKLGKTHTLVLAGAHPLANEIALGIALRGYDFSVYQTKPAEGNGDAGADPIPQSITHEAEKLAAATITAEVVDQHKGPKIKIHKFKNKTGYHKRQGHRQQLTSLRITGVSAK